MPAEGSDCVVHRQRDGARKRGWIRWLESVWIDPSKRCWTGEGGRGIGGVRRAGVRRSRVTRLDGRTGSDGAADRLERRQVFSGTLPQSGAMKKDRVSREARKEPRLQERDLAGLPLLCLSGSGQQRQRKSRAARARCCWSFASDTREQKYRRAENLGGGDGNRSRWS